jgi:hypothetical protein
MTVSIVLIIFAVVLAFLAFKFVKGMIKFGLIALVVIAAIVFLMASGIGR